MKNISKKLAFVSGIFNTIHPGHIRFFKFASEQAERLVVGLLADELLSDLSLLAEDERKLALEALTYIDEVVLVDKGISPTLEALKPDVVVKGSEFKAQVNEEQAIIEQWRGQLIFSSGEQYQSDPRLLEQKFDASFYIPVQPQQQYFKRHQIQKDDILQLLNNFEGIRLLVVGDIIVDEYLECDPVGMSREDPTIVVTPVEKRRFLGGAGIVAAHAAKLGASVDFISIVGEDDEAEFCRDYLKQENIKHTLITDISRPTTTKRRYRASGKTLLRVNSFRNHEPDEVLSSELLNVFQRQVKQVDLVIFSDFSLGLLSEPLVSQLQECCGQAGVPVAADSQTSSQVGDLAKFKHLLLASPTEHEVRVTMQEHKDSLVKVSERLIDKLDVKYLIPTMGESGSLIMYQNLEKQLVEVDSLPALNLNPVDVAGAGDAMLVSSALSLVAGANIWQAAYIGALTSACQVGRLGNVPVARDELIQKLGL